MILTIFGATGRVGLQVVNQALTAGHTVRAFGRNAEQLRDTDKNGKLVAIKGYVFDEESVFDALSGTHAVISVLGGAFDGSDKTRSLGIKNIAMQMSKAGVNRIVALGGMGVLTDENNVLLMDKPGYLKQYLPVGREHLQAFKTLKDSGLNWTFVCAPDIDEKEYSGKYNTMTEHIPYPNNGRISSADLAEFMIKEVAANDFLGKRVGISN